MFLQFCCSPAGWNDKGWDTGAFPPTYCLPEILQPSDSEENSCDSIPYPLIDPNHPPLSASHQHTWTHGLAQRNTHMRTKAGLWCDCDRPVSLTGTAAPWSSDLAWSRQPAPTCFPYNFQSSHICSAPGIHEQRSLRLYMFITTQAQSSSPPVQDLLHFKILYTFLFICWN